MKFMNRHSLYLSPHSQPGSGAPTGDAPGADGDDPKPAGNADDDNTPTLTFTQADLDRILADRLGRQEKKLRREFETTADKQKEDELADAAEWQTLADKRQKQIKTLEDKVSDLEKEAATAVKYGKALETYVTKLADGLPAPILALMDGMDQAAKLEWLTANRAQFVKADTPDDPPQKPDNGGVPPTPPASNDANLSDEQRRKVAYKASL